MLIAQLTDLHARPRGIPAARVVETNMLIERALRAVAALRPVPDVVLISGDLAECGRVEEYEVLVPLLRRYLPMPVFVVPGNHDRRENFRKVLAHMPGVTADPQFVQYAIDDFPVRLVMLDSVAPGFGHGDLCATRLAFLEQALAAAPGKPTLIALHHPPFACGIQNMDVIMLRQVLAFTEIIARYPQVGLIVSGHHHRAITGRVAQAIATVAPSVVHQSEFDLDPDAPAGFVLEPPAFQVHRWTRQDGFASHTVYVEPFPGPFPFLVDDDYPGRGGV